MGKSLGGGGLSLSSLSEGSISPMVRIPDLIEFAVVRHRVGEQLLLGGLDNFVQVPVLVEDPR